MLPSLAAGGAERIISFVSSNIDKEKFNSSLIIIGFEKDAKFAVEGIPVNYLNSTRVLFAVPKLIHQLKSVKPNLVVSSIFHLNIAIAIISFFFPKTKFIAREATILGSRNNKKIFITSMIKKSYRRFHAIICQSKDMSMDLMENYDVSPEKLSIINNPITTLRDLKIKIEKNEVPKYITIGRLEKVKGHLRLLGILSKLPFPYEYTVVGEGSLKERIYEEATALGILPNINFIPFTNDVYQFLTSHDLFLQGSYVEGFPNALLESCSVGTPVIAFDVPGGTKEIIRNGVNGFLVKDEIEFLNKLMKKVDWSPQSIRNEVVNKFNSPEIIGQYESLFFKIYKN